MFEYSSIALYARMNRVKADIIFYITSKNRPIWDTSLKNEQTDAKIYPSTSLHRLFPSSDWLTRSRRIISASQSCSMKINWKIKILAQCSCPQTERERERYPISFFSRFISIHTRMGQTAGVPSKYWSSNILALSKIYIYKYRRRLNPRGNEIFHRPISPAAVKTHDCLLYTLGKIRAEKKKKVAREWEYRKSSRKGIPWWSSRCRLSAR